MRTTQINDYSGLINRCDSLPLIRTMQKYKYVKDNYIFRFNFHTFNFPCYKNKFLYVFFLILIIFSIIFFIKNKNSTMPPPLVYLIPEEYFGPVFVFFGQKDGVDMSPDPLGIRFWSLKMDW